MPQHDGRLALGDAVEVAHDRRLCSDGVEGKRELDMLSWLVRRRARIVRIEAEAEALIRDLGDRAPIPRCAAGSARRVPTKSLRIGPALLSQSPA